MLKLPILSDDLVRLNRAGGYSARPIEEVLPMYLMIRTRNSYPELEKVIGYLPMEDLEIAMKPSMFGNRNFAVIVLNGECPPVFVDKDKYSIDKQ